MRTIAFNLFPEEEQDVFKSSCLRWGMRPKDFLVKAEELDRPAGASRDVRREVIVIHIPSSKGRRYQAGNGSRWNSAFQDDLQALYFSVRSPSVESTT
jgi:hypothetical protein